MNFSSVYKLFKKKESKIKPEEIYDLFWYISHYIRPRLEKFKEVSNGQYPSNITHEEWMNILQKMIDAFTLLEEKDHTTIEEDIIIDEGLELFVQWYRDLWC